MAEPRDDFDAALRDRIDAAESRVLVSSTPPEGVPAQGPAPWLPPVLVTATATAAVLLVLFVVGQIPDRSTGGSSPSPSAMEGVSVQARNGDFVLTLSAAQSVWTSGDAIQVTAMLSYEGDLPEVEISGGGGPVVFSLVQIEGGAAVLEGGQDLPCLPYRVAPDEPLVWSFEKSGGIDDTPPFDRAFFEEPELRLPPGRWQVRAVLAFGDTDCANWRQLEVSIIVDVVEAEGSPGPSAVATEPSTTSPEQTASATPTSGSDPSTISGVLEGDRQLEGGCIWLRDEMDRRWEVIWPDGYRAAFRDGVAVLLRGGRVVAEAGDTVTVRGHRPSGLGSHCMVGIVYQAESVADS